MPASAATRRSSARTPCSSHPLRPTAWAFTWAFETPHAVWTPGLLASLGYVTFCVSLGAMGLLLYMLRHGEAGRVASNFYLTPGVTALLAWTLLGEDLPAAMWPGFALTMIGVWLIRGRA